MVQGEQHPDWGPGVRPPDRTPHVHSEEEIVEIVRRVAGSRRAEAFAVGGVYTNTTGLNPSLELGYGTWVAIASGRVLVGYAEGDPVLGTLEAEVGAANHSHTYDEVITHTHEVDLGDVTHKHTVPILSSSIGSAGGNAVQGVDEGNATLDTSVEDSEAGVTDPPPGSVEEGTTAEASSLPPGFVVTFWKRTA